MSHKLIAAFAAGVLSLTTWSGTSRADLLLYEPFNYAVADMPSTGVWADSVNYNDPGYKINQAQGTIGPITLSNDGISLAYPGSAATQGSRVADTGGGTGSRALGFGMNLAGDNTHYASMLIRGSGLLQFYYGPHTDGQYYARTYLGIDSTGQFIVGSFPGLKETRSATYSNGTYDANETYLLVAKIDANPGVDDVFSLKIYDQSMTPDLIEPASFDLVATNGSGVNLNHILIGMTGAGQMDEIRVGTTWGDVSIPEPSSAALLLAAVLGACALLRPRGRMVR